MEKGSYGHIPCSVSGHNKAQEWPDSVIVERRDEDCCCTTGTKDVSPCSLVQIVIYVVYVTVTEHYMLAYDYIYIYIYSNFKIVAYCRLPCTGN